MLCILIVLLFLGVSANQSDIIIDHIHISAFVQDTPIEYKQMKFLGKEQRINHKTLVW